MTGDEEGVRRGIKIVRWSIAIVFAVALVSVEDPLAVIGGALLGWVFSAVGKYAKGPESSPPAVPLSETAWTQKPSKQPASYKSTPIKTACAPARERPVSLDESGEWPPPDWAIESGVLKFTYVDADGEVTERRVRNWAPDDEYDHCFRAYDLTRRQSRTFRIDRVDSWG